MYFLLFQLGTFIPYILQVDCYILIKNAVTVLLIPSLVILKLIAFSLEPFYKCILNVKPSYNNFVYNCIFQLRSRPLWGGGGGRQSSARADSGEGSGGPDPPYTFYVIKQYKTSYDVTLYHFYQHLWNRASCRALREAKY